MRSAPLCLLPVAALLACGEAVCGDGELEAGELCFDLPREVSVAIAAPEAMYMGDLDGDSHTDVLVLGTDRGATAQLLRGDGLGGLTPVEPSPLPPGCDPRGATAFYDDNRLRVAFANCGVGIESYSVAADGHLSLHWPIEFSGEIEALVYNSVDDSFVVLSRDGDALTLSIQRVSEFDGTAPPAAPTALPFPGLDPAAPFLMSVSPVGHIFVAQPGGRGFAEAAIWDLDATWTATDVPIAALSLAYDRDHKVYDVLVVDAANNEIVSYTGEPRVVEGRVALPADSRIVRPIPANGTNRFDIAVLRATQLEILTGSIPGEFSPSYSVDFAQTVADPQFAYHDLNGDRRWDLVVGFFDGPARNIRWVASTP